MEQTQYCGYTPVMSDSVRTNGEVADVFRSIADVMDIKGENAFKVRAYRNAVKTLETLSEPIAQIAADGRLDDIPGFGDAIIAKTTDILRTGTTPLYEQLRDTVPAGVIQMVNLPGIGPKTIRQLWEEHGIADLPTLELKARNGELALFPGLGEKSASKILASIERARRYANRYRIGEALPLAESLVLLIKERLPADKVLIVGPLRRGVETTESADLLICAKNSEIILDVLSSISLLSDIKIEELGVYKSRFHVGLPVNITVVEEEELGQNLLQLTGPIEFIRRLDLSIATHQGTEAEIFKQSNLDYVEPELRDSPDSVDAARLHELPRLVANSDIKGDLHAHTVASDGTLTVREMALAAKSLGYEYLAITDHSQSLRIANGLTVERLLEQRNEIVRVQDELGIRIFSGSEVDILADGTLDFDDDVLAKLDFVIASAHLYNGQDLSAQTKRVLRAIQNPNVDLIAHPTGRIINRRDPFHIDLDTIYAAAADNHTALEINAAPERLDLKDTDARRAAQSGVKIMVNTDAHSAANYTLMRYGIITARRAWLTPSDIINCSPLVEFESWLKR